MSDEFELQVNPMVGGKGSSREGPLGKIDEASWGSGICDDPHRRELSSIDSKEFCHVKEKENKFLEGCL